MSDKTTATGSDIPQEPQAPTTPPSDKGTTTPPSDKGNPPPADKGKTYSEEEVQRKLRGQASELERSKKVAEEAAAKLEAFQQEIAELKKQSEGIRDLQAQLEKAKAEREMERKKLMRFVDLKGPQGPLAADVEMDWLPADVLEVGEDGKATEAAQKSLEALLKSKPILAKRSGPGMPPIGAGASTIEGSAVSGKMAHAFAKLRGGSK